MLLMYINSAVFTIKVDVYKTSEAYIEQGIYIKRNILNEAYIYVYMYM